MKRILFLVKIDGVSALPVLMPGKYYFASSLIVPCVGRFIVFHYPKESKRLFVKRVKEIRPEGYYVEGLIPGASSSEDFGVVKKELVLGTLVFHSAFVRLTSIF